MKVLWRNQKCSKWDISNFKSRRKTPRIRDIWILSIWCTNWWVQLVQQWVITYIITKNMKEIFPNITQVLSILLTTAATSASVERAYSALRHVKTDFRSVMGEEHLNGLLLVCIHRDIFLDYDKIIDVYASRYPRMMLLINPLSEN